MYTKTLLLISLFLLISSMISDGSSRHLSVENAAFQTYVDHSVSPDKKGETTNGLDWSLNLKDQVRSTRRNHAEEDGKHHEYHFTRFDKTRSAKLWCMISKALLMLVHLSTFIALFSHSIH